jgi:hypothetical protein
VEESDEREGFSVGGVSGRVGSTRDGIVGGVIVRLPARDRVGLEDGVKRTVRDAREEHVVVSVEALGRCANRKLDGGREVMELVDGRRIRKEESRVDTVLGVLAVVQWDRVGDEGPGLGEEGGEGDRGGKCAEDAERRPSVDGRRIVSGSALDSTYWVMARGAGEIRRLRGQFDRRRWGSSGLVGSLLI